MYTYGCIFGLFVCCHISLINIWRDAAENVEHLPEGGESDADRGASEEELFAAAVGGEIVSDEGIVIRCSRPATIDELTHQEEVVKSLSGVLKTGNVKGE